MSKPKQFETMFSLTCLWVFGILVLDDPNFGGLRFPWTPWPEPSHMVSLGGLSQNSGYQDRSSEGSPGTSSHTYPGEMKMNDEKTVSNENVFQTRFLVCCFQLKLEM